VERASWRRGRLRGAAVVLAGLALAAPVMTAPAQAAAQSQAQGPTVKLVVAQKTVSLPRFDGQVFLDPGVWVASLGSALQFDVQRVTYSRPVTITQVIHRPGGGTRTVALPRSVLDGFNGLRNFLGLTVRNSHGQVVKRARIGFCPDTFDPERASPNSPAKSAYPQQCAAFDPFQKATVWGVTKGWAVDPFENFGRPYRLALGTYHVTVVINHPYLRLLGISPRHATASVTVKVVRPTSPFGTRRAPAAPLPSLPRNVPQLASAPAAALPDLVPLPSWGISTSHMGRLDLLNFGATVWIGGTSPLDVEGFRSNGSPVMKAYQYFWRNGHVIGRMRAGTMGFDSAKGHNHWHFEQFAEYRLLTSAKGLAVRSHKVGFCIAPSDGVDLLLPHAVWQPNSIGFFGQCGSPTALWVQEYLPVGWGDTYFQSVAGQSFNITSLPNGTYYIEVIANPLRVLHESNVNNDVSLRRVILGGTPGHRTVRVPAWHGIDPEASPAPGPVPTPTPTPTPTG